MTPAETQVALAGATVLCAGQQLSPEHEGWQTERHHDATCCNGTDRVYLFSDETGVRVSCACYSGKVPLHRTYDGQYDHTIECPDCQGRGWTAAEDGWEEAAVEAGASVFRTWWDRQQEQWMAEVRLVACHLPSSIAVGDTAEGARLAALLQAVEALEGVELGTDA